MFSRRGIMFVLSSPSGAGKTTLARQLLADNSDLVPSVSVTTRPMRHNECHGKDYYFVSPREYKDMIDNQEFLEYATVHDNGYGTPKKFVETALSSGKDVIFDIDWQGAKQLKQNVPHDVVNIFIMPPSPAELRRRLTGRGTDDDDIIEKRLTKAYSEMLHWQDYDYVVVNDTTDICVQKLQSILDANRLLKNRQYNIADFVELFHKI